jgi:hypothetical protein
MENTNDKNSNKASNKAQNKNDNASKVVYISQKTQRLAGALYALTRPFPADEPLRRSLRDQALALISSAHTLAEGAPLRDTNAELPALLNQLVSQLAVARDGGLVSGMNFSVFHEEITNFVGEIGDIGAFPGPFLTTGYFDSLDKALSHGIERNTPAVSSSSLGGTRQAVSADGAHSKNTNSSSGGKLSAKDKRRQKILNLFSDQQEITVNDVTDIVNGYSTKTIQRDLKALVKNGELEKHGKRRWSSYTKA